jgi:hypothetical protein
MLAMTELLGLSSPKILYCLYIIRKDLACAKLVKKQAEFFIIPTLNIHSSSISNPLPI